MKKNKLKICYIPYDGREQNDLAFDDKYEYRWTNVLKEKLEREGHEIHTYDVLPLEDADVILCFDNVYFQNARHFWKLFRYGKLGSTTHIDYEPPSANCRIHSDKGLRKLSHLFKSLITYNDNVVNGNTIIKGCIGDYLTKESPYKKDFKKRKLVTVLANYRVNLMLFGQHPDELYSKRGEAVAFFQDKCPDDFDLYGDFWPDSHQKVYRGPVERSQKQEVISKYKFLISYDSIRNQNGYISEKIFDCFKAKTVPVYWGADNVTDYIPKECFVDKRDFETYDDLYNYLISMTEEEYNQRIEAIETYLNSEQYRNSFSSEASAEIIYQQLMRKKRHVNYVVAFFILFSFQIKRWWSKKYDYDNYYYDNCFPKPISLYNYTDSNQGTFYTWYLRYQVKNKYALKFFLKSKEETVELPVEKTIYEASNTTKYEVQITIDKISKYPKTSFYVLDTKSGKEYPIKIKMDINFEGFKKYYYLKIKGNHIYYRKAWVTSKIGTAFLKIKHYLKKVVIGIITLPVVFVKQLLEVFSEEV